MEIDHRLKIADGQLVTYELRQIEEKVKWWLITPQGERWGFPSWGHKLIMFKHDPPSTSTEIAMESHIFEKLPRDIPSVRIHGIKVESINAHETLLYLDTPFGLVKTLFERGQVQ